MATFLIDEDMHRSLAGVLQALGHEAVDVRDVGLRGKSDTEIFAFAQERGAIIFTADLDFADITTYPPGSHAGIVVARFPNELSTIAMNAVITNSLKDLDSQDLMGNLVVLYPGKVRITRKP